MNVGYFNISQPFVGISLIGPGAKDAFLQHYMAKDLLELFLSKHLSFTPGSQEIPPCCLTPECQTEVSE